MAINIPQPMMPFALDVTGHPLVCDQGSTQDIGSQALVLLSCPLGGCPYDAQFGNPAQLFQPLPISTGAMISALQQYVPALTDVSASEVTDLINNIADIQITGYGGFSSTPPVAARPPVSSGGYPSDTLYPSDTTYPQNP